MTCNPVDGPTPKPLLTCAPLCGAKNRQGNPCRCPAMVGKKRCRLHGGKSPGAPRGPATGNYRHGNRTKDAMALRALIRHLADAARE